MIARAYVSTLLLTILFIISCCATPTPLDVDEVIDGPLRHARIVPLSVHQGKWSNDSPLRLIRIGLPAVPSLIRSLDDSDERLRYNCFYILAEISAKHGVREDQELAILHQIRGEEVFRVADMGLAVTVHSSRAQAEYVDVACAKLRQNMDDVEASSELAGDLLIHTAGWESNAKRALLCVESVFRDVTDPRVGIKVLDGFDFQFQLVPKGQIGPKHQEEYRRLVPFFIRGLAHPLPEVRLHSLEILQYRVPILLPAAREADVRDVDVATQLSAQYSKWWDKHHKNVTFDKKYKRFGFSDAPGRND